MSGGTRDTSTTFVSATIFFFSSTLANAAALAFSNLRCDCDCDCDCDCVFGLDFDLPVGSGVLKTTSSLAFSIPAGTKMDVATPCSKPKMRKHNTVSLKIVGCRTFNQLVQHIHHRQEGYKNAGHDYDNSG